MSVPATTEMKEQPAGPPIADSARLLSLNLGQHEIHIHCFSRSNGPPVSLDCRSIAVGYIYWIGKV